MTTLLSNHTYPSPLLDSTNLTFSDGCPTSRGTAQFTRINISTLSVQIQFDKRCFESEWDSVNDKTSPCIKGFNNIRRAHPSAVHYLNMSKNRYQNVLPVEDTRVKLLTGRIDANYFSGTQKGTDYINANYVTYRNRTTIATMAPLKNTFNDFWTMIWENDVPIIMMILKLMENGKVKGEKYWPEFDENIETCDFKVTLLSYGDINCANTVIRNIQIERKLDGSKKTVVHVHYLGWPDFGVPDNTDSFRKLIKLFNDNCEEGSIPVVHCSAGIGRTGTFLAVLYGLDEFFTNNKDSLGNITEHNIDIEKIVLSLREQRNRGMVQRKEQYELIHKAINDELKESHNNNKKSSCIF